MPRHVDAWIDSVQLSSIGPFMISQVSEDAPALEISEAAHPARYGSRLMGVKRQSLKVTLEAVIRERFDLSLRAAHMEALAAWAQGSASSTEHVLELSHRPLRRLHVVCTSDPTLGDVRDYTQPIRMEFTAHAVPYWEDITATTASASGESGTCALVVPGSALTPVDLTVKPTGGKLTSFSATLGAQHIDLSGLNVPQNGTLTFWHDFRDDMLITYGAVSLLSKRSAASSDDLLAAPGARSLTFEANTACSVTLSVRGRWA